MRKVFVLALLASLVHPPAPALAAEPRDSIVSGSTFTTVLPATATSKTVKVAPFRMDRALVSNAEFANFLKQHPEWRRGNVPKLFGDSQYLTGWRSPADPGSALARKPVTQVSWFAASAYCEAQGKRLPRWYEWELVAAASDKIPDARADASWRQKILDWYAKSASGPLPDAGASAPNYYGIRDLHGVAWEWVEDAGGMLVSDDGREQGDGGSRFCGAGATSFEQKENYAMLMRIAMLSSMKASYTSSSMSFRCAADLENK
jgi:formylglycine-generating enzyme required for sulfatase activity